MYVLRIRRNQHSNTAGVSMILQGADLLWLLSRSLIVENDSTNAIFWVFHVDYWPWKLQFCNNKVKALSSHIHVTSLHVIRSANSLTNVIAEKRADRYSPWAASIASSFSLSSHIALIPNLLGVFVICLFS